jgi:hypothetical protein
MNEKMTCEEFNAGLSDFALDMMSAADAAAMEAHLDKCEGCREIYEIKRALVFDALAPEENVPEEVEEDLVHAVISDVTAAREAGMSRRSWGSRFLMPAMAAAIIIFVFLTGFMLGEIRNLHREAGELREEVAVMETVLTGRTVPGRRSVFGRMTGGIPSSSMGLTMGDAAMFLESLPADTPVLSEGEAERLIAMNRGLRRLAGYIDERPWEGGLTSGELLLVIIALDIDPGTKIPDEWRDIFGKAKFTERAI